MNLEINKISKRTLLGICFSLMFCLFLSCKKGEVINQEEDSCNTVDYSGAPDQVWFSSYGGSGEESHGHYVLSCVDGGFLQVGETGFIPNSAKILIVKTDSEGDLLWKKELSEGGHNLGNTVLEVDDGYLVCGAVNENSTLIKLNKTDGSLMFMKSFDIGGNDAFEHLAVLNDEIIAVGYKNAEDGLNTFYTEGEGSISFLSDEGELIRSVDINEYLSHAYRVEVFAEDLIISGLTQEANDYGIVKMNSAGAIVWAKEFGGSLSDHCFGMDISREGAIYLTGHTLSGTENWDTYTMKIDIDGNQVWEAKKGNPRGFDPKYIHDEAWGVGCTIDGGCIVVAGTGDEYEEYNGSCEESGDNSNVWQVYLIKYSSSGSVEWQKTFQSDDGNDWAGEGVDVTFEGSVIVAVDNGEFGFLKLDTP